MRPITVTAPYVAGYLAFREVPPLIELINELREAHSELVPQVNTGDTAIYHIYSPREREEERERERVYGRVSVIFDFYVFQSFIWTGDTCGWQWNTAP